MRSLSTLQFERWQWHLTIYHVFYILAFIDVSLTTQMLPKMKEWIFRSSYFDHTWRMPIKKLKRLGIRAQSSYLREEFDRHVLVVKVVEEDGDDVEAHVHRQIMVSVYLIFMVWSAIFTNKSNAYTHLVYIRIYRDLEMMDDYTWGNATLTYLYMELNVATKNRTKKLG